VGASLALTAACAFALGLVLQQRGTMSTLDGSGRGPWLLQILRKPIWLAGGIVQGIGWVLQALALDRAPLAVVQSITTLSLVIALPLGVLITKQRMNRTVWLGALAVVVGIIVFVVVGSPGGGTNTPSGATWVAACLVSFALVGIFALIGHAREGAVRAVFFGIAAGFGFALQAAVVKIFDAEVGGGILSIFQDWPIYVIIASAIVGLVFQQSALRTGVLAPAMASANCVTLFAGVVLGVVVYGETLQGGSGHVVPALLGLLLALVGVGFLATAPPPADAQPPTATGTRAAPAS
jgi:drug/metabolite transporter (DMT)-like permease